MMPRIWERKNPEQSSWTRYIWGANKRGLAWELTRLEHDILIHGPCRYCNHFNESKTIGIDRVDNTDGYYPDNCVPCCKTCNIMKMAMTAEEFIERCRRVATHSYPRSSHT